MTGILEGERTGVRLKPTMNSQLEGQETLGGSFDCGLGIG